MRSRLSLLVLGAMLLPLAARAQTAPVGVIAETRSAIADQDFKKGEKIVLNSLSETGTTAEAIEAWSWLGRGALAAKMYKEADAYALRTYTLVEEALMTRKLDDETHLPLALGASIEVQTQVQVAQGARSDAVVFLKKEMERYKNTSIITRLTKNLNLISLEGQPAFAFTTSEWLTADHSTMADLKGKPVVLFLWAHWCPDCKTFGPILEAALNKYKSSGLTVVGATQRFGYVAKRKPAPPDEELTYIFQVRDEFYPWMKKVPSPVSSDLYALYGVSSSPTVVFIDRAGNVSRYNPGRLTAEELDAALKPIMASSSASPALRQD